MGGLAPRSAHARPSAQRRSGVIPDGMVQSHLTNFVGQS